MEITFDPEKDGANRAKHGLSLGFGRRVIAGRVAVVRDDRFDYGEDRFVCFGYVERRLYVCVYALRDEDPRVISVRKANQREVKRYGRH